jgi:hypothetical protein
LFLVVETIMSYRSFVLAAGALVLAWSTGAHAQPAGERRPPAPPSAAELQRSLGLDAAKSEQVVALMARHGQARQQLHEQQRSEMQALLSPEQLRQLQRGRRHERHHAEPAGGERRP